MEKKAGKLRHKMSSSYILIDSLPIDNCFVVDNNSLIRLNDGRFLYQQTQQSQMAQPQYVLQEDDIQSDGTMPGHSGQIFFSADSQQISDVQSNLQLIEQTQNLPRENVQQTFMQYHHQSAISVGQSSQLIVEHPTPSTSQVAQQQHVIIAPPSLLRQSQPIVINPSPQNSNATRPSYTVYSQTTSQKRVFQQTQEALQLKTVSTVEQQTQLQRTVQVGQVRKTITQTQ
ncbi:hypothetical protein Bhyg_08339, partial [Pseudolycoriella hygida]